MDPEKPATILVIDDDRPFARSVQILLEDEGHHLVSIAPSANHALDALGITSRIDLLIVDFAILERHGDELSRAIHNLGDGIPVIVLSAHEAALAAAQHRHIGTDGWLSKPIDPSALLSTVEAVLLVKQHANRPEPSGLTLSQDG